MLKIITTKVAETMDDESGYDEPMRVHRHRVRSVVASSCGTLKNCTEYGDLLFHVMRSQYSIFMDTR